MAEPVRTVPVGQPVYKNRSSEVRSCIQQYESGAWFFTMRVWHDVGSGLMLPTRGGLTLLAGRYVDFMENAELIGDALRREGALR